MKSAWEQQITPSECGHLLQSDFPGAADYGADVTRRLDRIERDLADYRSSIAAIERKHASIHLAVDHLAAALAGLRAALAKAGS